MRIAATLLLFVLCSGCAAVREAESRGMQRARLALQQASVGKLDKQGAYARYGRASRVIQLPSGHTGWVYQVNDTRFAERTYTLDFAPDGVLHDVFYTNPSGERISAREVQGLEPSLRP